jgi:uncharacterized membrane protein
VPKGELGDPSVESTTLRDFHREPEGDLSRLLALSDGVFAFSMTLLVLSLVPGIFGMARPISLSWFLSQPNFVSGVLAYLLGFFVTGLYWVGHNRIFALIFRCNNALVQLNMIVLVFVVLVPFATAALNLGAGSTLGSVLYATIQAGAGFSLLGVWWYASKDDRLTSPELPVVWARYVTFRTALGPCVFLVSIPIAFVNGAWAEYSWFAVFGLSFLRFAAIRTRFFPGIVE